MNFLKVSIYFIAFFYCRIIDAQNVGIGIQNPSEKLEVNGAVKIGGTNNTGTGTIRWNQVKSDFEGFNGSGWVSLTGGKGGWGSQAAYSTENSATVLALNYENSHWGTKLGYSVAASGNWMVAGAILDVAEDNFGTLGVGSVRVFKKDQDKWGYKYRVMSFEPNANDQFGSAVGMTATHIISGSPKEELPNKVDVGVAYVYSYSDQGILLQDTLTSSDGASYDLFGNFVAIDGDYAVVSAYAKTVGGMNYRGKAYLYLRNGVSWPQIAEFNPPDGAAGDWFGSSVSIWGNYAAVGASEKNINGNAGAGKVYLYRKSAIGWVLIAQIVSPVVKDRENFGKALYIRDNKMFVGAPDKNGNITDTEGKVYVYNLNNNDVVYHSTIVASDGMKSDNFGYSVTYNDSTLLIGAPDASVGAATKQGKVYAYKLVGDSWQEQAILTSGFPEINMAFGSSVALTTDFGIVGAPNAAIPYNLENGRVFFFKR